MTRRTSGTTAASFFATRTESNFYHQNKWGGDEKLAAFSSLETLPLVSRAFQSPARATEPIDIRRHSMRNLFLARAIRTVRMQKLFPTSGVILRLLGSSLSNKNSNVLRESAKTYRTLAERKYCEQQPQIP
jgi:hypothetical protein